MVSLLQITNASKHYGDQVLLDGADATITDNVKVGFVGRNGAGKSTLLRIFLGEEELDGGEVVRHPSLHLGYLRQHDPFLPGESAMDFLMRDSDQPNWKCGEVAGEFELKGAYLHGPISKLSGGWQTRVKLAALLLHEPNLLLLDEPTNFLDLATQILLEHFLKHYDAGCLIVSHDQTLLNATCDHTLGLSRGKLTSFPGKVDAYLQFMQERARARRAVKQGDHGQSAGTSKTSVASNRAQGRDRQTGPVEEQDARKAGDAGDPRRRTAGPHPPAADRAAQGIALRCKDLAIGYPDRQIASDIQLELEHGSRAAVVGDNGQG